MMLAVMLLIKISLIGNTEINQGLRFGVREGGGIYCDTPWVL